MLRDVAKEKLNYKKVCSVLVSEGIAAFGGPLQLKAVVVYLVHCHVCTFFVWPLRALRVENLSAFQKGVGGVTVALASPIIYIYIYGIKQTLVSKATYSNSCIHSYIDGGGRPAHQDQFVVQYLGHQRYFDMQTRWNILLFNRFFHSLLQTLFRCRPLEWSDCMNVNRDAHTGTYSYKHFSTAQLEAGHRAPPSTTLIPKKFL